MVAPRNKGIRRLKLDELIAKLAQIEEQAALTLQEYPHGLTVERQRLIVGIAKQVKSHLEDQLRRGGREPQATDTEENHLHAVDAKRRNGTQ
jgi:hypothetical protein